MVTFTGPLAVGGCEAVEVGVAAWLLLLELLELPQPVAMGRASMRLAAMKELLMRIKLRPVVVV
jgi:hypothetical protein